MYTIYYTATTAVLFFLCLHKELALGAKEGLEWVLYEYVRIQLGVILFILYCSVQSAADWFQPSVLIGFPS